MTKIQRYACILQIFSIFLAIGMFVLLCTRWLFDVTFISWLSSINLEGNDPATIPFGSRLLGFVVDGIALCIAYVGIIFFNCLMQRFQAGEFFSLTVISLLHKLSRIMLCFALYTPLQSMLLSVIITFHKGVGNRVLSLTIGTGEIANIFIFMCLVLITTLIQEGSKIKQEQELVI